MYLCFVASSENAYIDPMVSIARITPRRMPIDFHAVSFNIGPLVKKLIRVYLFNVSSLNMVLLDELRLSWEALCTEMVLEGSMPGFVV